MTETSSTTSLTTLTVTTTLGAPTERDINGIDHESNLRQREPPKLPPSGLKTIAASSISSACSCLSVTGRTSTVKYTSTLKKGGKTTTSTSTTTTVNTVSTTTTTTITSTSTATETASPPSDPTCRQVTFTVSGQASNRNLTNIDFTTLNGVLTAVQAPVIAVVGPQTLKGTFCPPTALNFNNSKLQVLFHGFLQNREIWDGLSGTFASLSYVRFMSDRGYPVLYIDRLGNGESPHPDPLLVAQSPYEDALYHDLVTQIKSGTTGQLPTAYSTLIYVGHGYGSILGTTSAQKFPTDFSAYILTGFSNQIQQSFAGFQLLQLAPAAIADPARFGSLAPGYLTATSSAGWRNTFFFIDQSQYAPGADSTTFRRRDVVAAGQFVSAYLGPVQAPEYTGRVLVLTGENDQIFCGPGSPVIGPASCGNILAQTGSLFPSADYSWFSLSNTGHMLQLHVSAPTGYGVVARFLAGQQFPG